MTLFGRRLSPRQTVAAAFAVFACGFASTVAIGAAQSSSYARPAVTVLGAGNRLSVLVTDGTARLLIAGGDDPAGFGNALAKARPLGHARVDILLLAGTKEDATLLSRARRAVPGRHIELIGKPGLIGELGLPADAHLLSPRRFWLSPDTSVTIETTDRVDAKRGPDFAWRATIEHGAARVVVLSDGRVAADFVDLGPVSALIVGGKEAVAAVGQIATRVLVVSAEAVTGKQVRTDVAGAVPHQTWVVRVFAGEAERFEFIDEGLQLPGGAISVGATPHAAR